MKEWTPIGPINILQFNQETGEEKERTLYNVKIEEKDGSVSIEGEYFPTYEELIEMYYEAVKRIHEVLELFKNGTFEDGCDCEKVYKTLKGEEDE